MKRSHIIIGALVAALFVGGCSRSSAPAKDATGATPTGQTLTVKVTGDVPTAFLSAKRGDAMPANSTITIPFEQTYNVRGSDRLEFASGVENAMNTKTASNIRIELLLNGKSVATATEGATIPYGAHITYTVPES